ncbi:hypothetical protein [Streptomyces zaomyceticus]|uniref:hypothetical protein n=1 Tax=Streptomyces zaomyceticus TaxID=68286 RepID=UPI00344A96A7
MVQVTRILGTEWLRRIRVRRAAGRRRRLPNRWGGARDPVQGNRREGWGLVAVSLPGLAALAALLFTWVQVGQASKELQISEQGQITNRFNAAIGNVGSGSMDVCLGGIYALQRIMQDSVRDHGTIVSVRAAYVRQHAPVAGEGARPRQTGLAEPAPPADVQAVMTVLADRLPSRDAGPALELQSTDLRGLKFRIAPGHRLAFRGAVFSFARLCGL